jgi:site-specific recombinase XerD
MRLEPSPREFLLQQKMDLLERFKTYLREKDKSDLTIKNYVSDVRRFIGWFENISHASFDIHSVNTQHIDQYRQSLSSSLYKASEKRHRSSLNQFFLFLADRNILASKDINIYQSKPETQTYSFLGLNDFKSFLYEQKASGLTIKNYLADVRQFSEWLRLVLDLPDKQIDQKKFFGRLNKKLLDTYKERLLLDKQLSPSSINRKLCSLRTYIKFVSKYNSIDQDLLQIENLNKSSGFLEEKTYSKLLSLPPQTEEKMMTNPTYASFPAIRMLQKMAKFSLYLIEISFVVPLAEIILICQKALWFASGGKIFFSALQTANKKTRIDSLIVKNADVGFYAPLPDSYAHLPLLQRLFRTIRHNRPLWYKKYHSYSFVHYLHLGILGIAVTLMGSLLYHRLSPSVNQRVLGTEVMGSGRELDFKGLLLDANAKAITTNTPVRFGLYDDRIASGSSLLWETVKTVNPDSEGNFSVSLGDSSPIPTDVFSSGKSLYLGIAINNHEELRPRQPVANVHLAQDAQRLSGMVPTTDENAGGQNVILALDSAGNLTIGKASPTFQATDGTFSLKAKSLMLSTTPQSNGNIILSPDGFGVVDISRPIQNTSQYGTLPDTLGAVEVADTFAVLATSSGQSAFTINQNDSGPLISASSSGIAKFTLDNTGAGYFASNLMLDGTDLSTHQFAINLFNRNAGIVNFAGQSIAVTIGSQSGTTTIRNPSTNLEGNLSIGGKRMPESASLAQAATR